MAINNKDYERLRTSEGGEETVRRAYANVFSSDNGELVLADLRYWFSAGSTLKPNPLSPDPLQTTICEAKRFVVLHIEGMMEKEEDDARTTDSGADTSNE